MSLPRRCVRCVKNYTHEGSLCTDCKRAERRVRYEDEPISRAVRAASPVCACRSDCRWHAGRPCGETENLTADHVLSLSKGGTNHDDRQTLCNRCNARKRDRY